MQLPKSESLLSYEIACLPEGYLSVNKLLESFDIHILEASPIMPGHFMVLANPLFEDLKKAYQMIKTSFKPHLIMASSIEKVQKETLLAFYGLQQPPLQDMLLVMETKSIVMAIDIVNDLSYQKLITPIEIRSSRSLGQKSLVYATLTREQKVPFQKHIQQTQGEMPYFQLIPTSHSYWHSLF